MTKVAADTSFASLLKEHPAPWSSQEEIDGRPVPQHYQQEQNVYTDDARRRHVVRDARGNVVIECAKFSKTEEERLARLIALIPQRMVDIERLRSALIDTLENSRLKLLTELDRIRTHLVEAESTISKFNVRLGEVLKTAEKPATSVPAPTTTLSEVQQAPPQYQAESKGHPLPWDYKEEPDIEGGAT